MGTLEQGHVLRNIKVPGFHIKTRPFFPDH